MVFREYSKAGGGEETGPPHTSGKPKTPRNPDKDNSIQKRLQEVERIIPQHKTDPQNPWNVVEQKLTLESYGPVKEIMI